MFYFTPAQVSTYLRVELEELRSLRDDTTLKRLKRSSRDYSPGEVIAMIALNYLRTEGGVSRKTLAPFTPALVELCSGLHPLRSPTRQLGFFGTDRVALCRGAKNRGMPPAYTVPIRQLAQRFVSWVLAADDTRSHRAPSAAG
jgi:hypothetical protein